MSIAASELILNERGAIYHLNLKPDELANLVITVGDPDRVKEVSKHFDYIEFKSQHREFVVHTGFLGSKRITVLSSGIGPDNIDIVMNELDACANINFTTREVYEQHRKLTIVRMGTCGSLNRDINVDGLVLSLYGIGLDNLLHFYNPVISDSEMDLKDKFVSCLELPDTRITPYAFAGALHLMEKFSEEFHRGITVTCPGFYAPQGRTVRATLRLPFLISRLSSFQWHQHKVSNFEMETSAIYGLARVFDHQGMAINTVVANRISQTFSRDPAAAIARMIVKSLEELIRLPETT